MCILQIFREHLKKFLKDPIEIKNTNNNIL